MRSLTVAIVAVASLLCVPSLTLGDYATATIKDTDAYYGSNRGVAVAGGTFSFEIWLDTSFDAYGANTRIQTQTEGGAPSSALGIFKLISVVSDGVTGWDNDDPTLPDALSGAPGSATSQLITCLPLESSVFVASGDHRWLTITGSVDASAVAGSSYYFNLVDIAVSDVNFDQVDGGAGGIYRLDITAIPAPAALPLGLLGLGLVGWCRKRLGVDNSATA